MLNFPHLPASSLVVVPEKIIHLLVILEISGSRDGSGSDDEKQRHANRKTTSLHEEDSIRALLLACELWKVTLSPCERTKE